MNKVQIKKLKTWILNTVSIIDKKGILYDLYKKNKSKHISLEGSLYDADKVLIDCPNNIPKPFVGLVKESDAENAYWPKYEKFLRENDILMNIIDPHKSTFG